MFPWGMNQRWNDIWNGAYTWSADIKSSEAMIFAVLMNAIFAIAQRSLENSWLQRVWTFDLAIRCCFLVNLSDSPSRTLPWPIPKPTLSLSSPTFKRTPRSLHNCANPIAPFFFLLLPTCSQQFIPHFQLVLMSWRIFTQVVLHFRYFLEGFTCIFISL